MPCWMIQGQNEVLHADALAAECGAERPIGGVATDLVEHVCCLLLRVVPDLLQVLSHLWPINLFEHHGNLVIVLCHALQNQSIGNSMMMTHSSVGMVAGG